MQVIRQAVSRWETGET
ncbi:hypothetical protein [Eubacterium sp. An11]|nr:hypothetical protein [Eubacterium sp. An11]